jgi:hypothetical protein
VRVPRYSRDGENFSVIPAKAGIHFEFCQEKSHWIPAFAGMTNYREVSQAVKNAMIAKMFAVGYLEKGLFW